MATKKSTNNKASNAPMQVGLDIGYGVTKLVTDDQRIVFPSVLGLAREIKFKAEELTTKYPGEQLWDDENNYFVGDLALSQLRSHEQLRLRGRAGDEWEFRVLFAKTALGKLFTGQHTPDEVVHVEIATGLPVDHMRDAGKMKAALSGQHVIKTDAAHVIVNVTNVRVMPQPYGTIYANMLKTNGAINECHMARTTGVVDVGTYTVDLAYDQEAEYIDALSGSIESGVWTAQERIANLIESEYREKPRYQVVEGVLRSGCFKVRGMEINYSEEVEEALEQLRTATLNLMGERWKMGVNLDVIYLSGGGAELVREVIMGAFPQTQMVKDSQLANARGYLNYAKFAAMNAEG